MSPEREALGRGLDQLLGRTETSVSSSSLENHILQVAVERINPDSRQPRKFFDELSLKELADSIKEQGLLQPILVSQQEDGKYKIIAGERRWRAVQKLGWSRIPVIVKNDKKQEDQHMILALVENLQRQDLNPMEEAHAFYWLLEKNNWSQKKLAETVGRDRSSIANTLRLLQLHPDVQRLLSKNRISLSIAKLLLQEKSQEKQKIWARQASRERLTVRELERKLKRSWKHSPTNPEIPFWLKEGCVHLSKKWNLDVKVRKSSRQTFLVLSFSGEEQLKDFIDHV